MRGLLDGGVVVGGSADGVPSLQFYDATGSPTWSFDHDTPIDVPPQATLADAAALDASALVVLTRPEGVGTGFILLLDLETEDTVWAHHIDDEFIGYPYSDSFPTFSARTPQRLAVLSGGRIGVVVRGVVIYDHFLTMRLDAADGAVLWKDYATADWRWSSGFLANNVGGWFAHVSSYSGFGSSSYWTRRRDAATGELLLSPSGPSDGGSPGPVAGRPAMRSDGVLVVPTTISWSGPSDLAVQTQRPDGTSAGSVGLVPEAGRAAWASVVDDADRVYMLLGGDAGDQSVVRFDVDLSYETVLLPDEQTALRDLASTEANDLIVLGNDGVSFVERLCPDDI